MSIRIRRRSGGWPMLVPLVLGSATLTGCTAVEQWQQGEVHGPWTVRYDGYGTVEAEQDAVILEPKSAADHEITHGGLVHTTAQCTDPSFAVTVATQAQVREGEPNPWEVAWVLWDFVDDTHFYAIALKPNGWELTKQDTAYPGNQRFLATGDQPTFPIRTEYRVEVHREGPRMQVHVDGRPLVEFVDEDSPYLGGGVALYTEDARVRFSDVDLPDCLRG